MPWRRQGGGECLHRGRQAAIVIIIIVAALALVSTVIEAGPASGIINVRNSGAKGDGVSDDTAALLSAIAQVPVYTTDHPYNTRIVYFPAGIYRVSNTILRKDSNGFFQANLVLIGESRYNTTIKLADNASGFGDRANPKAIVYTSSGLIFTRDPTNGGRDYLSKGEGNEAF